LLDPILGMWPDHPLSRVVQSVKLKRVSMSPKNSAAWSDKVDPPGYPGHRPGGTELPRPQSQCASDRYIFVGIISVFRAISTMLLTAAEQRGTYVYYMRRFSTSEVAAKIGLHRPHLQRAIAQGRVKAPPLMRVGRIKMRLWTAKDIERARKGLRVRNGRRKSKK
jgi:hypothetical protein